MSKSLNCCSGTCSSELFVFPFVQRLKFCLLSLLGLEVNYCSFVHFKGGYVRMVVVNDFHLHYN